MSIAESKTLVDDYALVARCWVCGVLFFAVASRAIPDAADDIAELRKLNVKFEWVKHEVVRQEFETACDHVKGE